MATCFHAKNTLIDEVKAHAQTNYDKGGWDVIVECWTDSEIAEFLTKANVRSLSGAIKACFRLRVGCVRSAGSGQLSKGGLVKLVLDDKTVMR